LESFYVQPQNGESHTPIKDTLQRPFQGHFEWQQIGILIHNTYFSLENQKPKKRFGIITQVHFGGTKHQQNR